MKTAIFANSTLAIPAIYTLYQHQLLYLVILPEVTHEDTPYIIDLLKKMNIPYVIVNETKMDQISSIFASSGINLALVMTFPYVIPEGLMNLPQHGTFNFHYAPLPEYRGANPIFWQLKNRDKSGAVTVHKMTPQIDQGPIFHKELLPIDPLDTFGSLKSKLSIIGGQLSAHLIASLIKNEMTLIEQDETSARTWPRPNHENVNIEWDNQSAEEIAALCRACNPWNKGAMTTINNSPVKITDVSVYSGEIEGEHAAGSIIECNEEHTLIACRKGEALKLEVIYFDQGFYPGNKLHVLGIEKGMKFSSLQPATSTQG